jgi:hypothetical protein
LVYALSVFTHIDEFEIAWLCELRRVLQPGGIAYITVHTDRTWRTLNPHHQLYHNLINRKDVDISPDSFAKPMPSDRIVFKRPPRGANDSILFHSTEYIFDTWGRFLDVADVRKGPDYPDIVVMKKSP